ncbi:MAG: hypothetical protein IPO90_15795 [Flavobacteriales bacterium]|nr:hypothetical protein [Flavobacteriales bacterium]
MENRHYTTDAARITNAKGQDSRQRRFHQEVDPAVRNTVGPHGMVVVASIADHYAHFMNAVEKADLYQRQPQGKFRPVALDRDDQLSVGEFMHAEQKPKHLSELAHAADGTAKFCTGMDDIWAMTSEPWPCALRGARPSPEPPGGKHRVVLMDERSTRSRHRTVDAIIEEQIEHGGEVRILPNGSMDPAWEYRAEDAVLKHLGEALHKRNVPSVRDLGPLEEHCRPSAIETVDVFNQNCAYVAPAYRLGSVDHEFTLFQIKAPEVGLTSWEQRRGSWYMTHLTDLGVALVFTGHFARAWFIAGPSIR